jgi:D-beta-D-heptose 7-phosphate kinase/D-beta-D-heptose 1-phosphate adenosyltransferase
MIRGWINGVFDLRHSGHDHLLAEAISRCDLLIVGLNSDESVRALKGPGRPVDTIQVRAKNVLACLRPDDLVLEFHDEDDLLAAIKFNKPDVIFKGAEYEGKPVTGSDLAEVVFIPMVDGVSTTRIIEERKLREAGV